MPHKQSILTSIDGYTVRQKYQLNNGFHKGKYVVLIWIARHKQLVIGNKTYRQVLCQLLNTKRYINTQLNYLSPINQNVDSSKKKKLNHVSNKIIIKLAKLGNKDAKQEFIRRFKKSPKLTA